MVASNRITKPRPSISDPALPGIPSITETATKTFTVAHPAPVEQPVAQESMNCRIDAVMKCSPLCAFIPQMLKQLSGNRHAQAMLLRQHLAIAKRADNSEALGVGLLLASQHSFSVSEVIRFEHIPDSASQSDAEPLPDYIGEWLHSPMICFARLVSDGYMFFLPNDAMRQTFFQPDLVIPPRKGSETFRGLEPVDLHHMSQTNFMRSMMCSVENRAELAFLVCTMLGEVGKSAPFLGPLVMNHASAQSDRPLYLKCADGSMQTFKMWTRMCSRDMGRLVWTVVNFTPVAASGESLPRAILLQGSASPPASGSCGELFTPCGNGEGVERMHSDEGSQAQSPTHLPAMSDGAASARASEEAGASVDDEVLSMRAITIAAETPMITDADIESLIAGNLLDESALESLFDIGLLDIDLDIAARIAQAELRARAEAESRS